MIECPYCHKDATDEVAKIKSVHLCRKYKLVREYVDPGGRLLIFPFGLEIRLGDMCYWCDHETLVKRLAEK